MSALLEVRNLTVSIPVRHQKLNAVRGIDLSIEVGQTLCLVGESGCGKSVTAMAILGLLSPRIERHADMLRFGEHDLSRLSARQLANIRGRNIAMIFQDPVSSLNPTLDVERQLCEGVMRHEGISRSEAKARAIALLDRVGISHPAERLSQYPHEFSGGQRQRIMIAMALMGSPQLLIADEPTTALDVTIQAQILTLLAELKEELGLALLLITHDLGVVAAIADRLAVMYAGRIVETGPSDAIYTQPMHPYTRGLMSAIPVPGVTPPGQPLSTIPGRVPELLGVVKGCAFHDRCSQAEQRCKESSIPLHTYRSSLGNQIYECVLDENGTPG